MNILSLAVDSLMCGLSGYLTFQIIKLIFVLKRNFKHHSIGTMPYWHWVQHAIAASVCLFGSVGLTLTTFLNALHSVLVPTDMMNIYNDLSISAMVTGVIIIISHIKSEETPGNPLQHFPQDEDGDFIERRRLARRHNDNNKDATC